MFGADDHNTEFRLDNLRRSRIQTRQVEATAVDVDVFATIVLNMPDTARANKAECLWEHD